MKVKSVKKKVQDNVHKLIKVSLKSVVILNIQGHRKGRTQTTGLLRNLKMLFRCCIWAHFDHKLGTFYYLHQHSQKLHLEIYLDAILFT